MLPYLIDVPTQITYLLWNRLRCDFVCNVKKIDVFSFPNISDKLTVYKRTARHIYTCSRIRAPIKCRSPNKTCIIFIYVYRYTTRIVSEAQEFSMLTGNLTISIRLACIPHYHCAVYTHICIMYGIVCAGHSIGISCYFSRIWVRVAGAVKHDVYMHIAECRRRQQRRRLDLFWGKKTAV